MLIIIYSTLFSVLPPFFLNLDKKLRIVTAIFMPAVFAQKSSYKSAIYNHERFCRRD
jgi:hypothetical protein